MGIYIALAILSLGMSEYLYCAGNFVFGNEWVFIL